MFRRQTIDAPFVRHSLARKETRGMLHSKEGAAAAAEEWKRRGRRCCYGTIDARYLRKKDGLSAKSVYISYKSAELSDFLVIAESESGSKRDEKNLAGNSK